MSFAETLRIMIDNMESKKPWNEEQTKYVAMLLKQLADETKDKKVELKRLDGNDKI